MASETRQDPERIYLEPAPYSPEGRQWCADDVWPLDGDGPGGVEYIRADLHEAEIARLTRELQALRRIVVDLHWMARRYVDGRTSYATRLFNDHTRALVALGVELNRTSDGTIWARDGMGRAYDGLSEEEAAQGEPAPAWLHEEDWKAARAHARRLCVALRAIRDEASIGGPPLERRREEWEAALSEADEVLGELEALYG